MPFDDTTARGTDHDLTTGLGRLRRLRDVFLAVPPERVRMGVWMSEDLDCGTVGCIAGWGAMDPQLRSQGLRLCPRTRVPCVVVDGLRLFANEALAHFFRMNYMDVYNLFTACSIDQPEYIATRDEAVRRLDRAIASAERRAAGGE